MWSYFRTYFKLRRYILSRLHAKIKRESIFSPEIPDIWNTVSDENSIKVKMIMKTWWSDTGWIRAKEITRPSATSFTTNHMWVPVKKKKTSEMRFRRLFTWDIRYKIHKSNITNLLWNTGSSKWRHVLAFLL